MFLFTFSGPKNSATYAAIFFLLCAYLKLLHFPKFLKIFSKTPLNISYFS